MANENLPSKVLIVDRDRSVGQGLQGSMQKYGINIQSASDFETALYLFNQQRFEVVIIEIEFEPVSGLTMMQKFRDNTQGGREHVGIILATGKPRKAVDANLAKELGEVDIVEKPLKAPVLLTLLARAFERRRIAEQLSEIRELSYDMLKKTGDLDAALTNLNGKLPGLDQYKIPLALDLIEASGDLEKGLQYLDQLTKAAPDDIRLLNAKGRLLLRDGKAVAAKEVFEKADKAAPHNVQRIEAMVKMYLDLKDPDASKAKMKELIYLKPELKDLKFNLVQDLDDAGFQEHAIALCKESSNPKEVVRYYNNKGVTLSKDGDVGSALKDYYTALIFFPKYKDNYKILFNIALAEISRKNREGFVAAEEALEKCLKLAPDFEKARKLLIIVQERLAKAYPNTA